MATNDKFEPLIRDFRDLRVWQVGLDLVDDIYDLTAQFPADERYGLTSQLRRAARSIPASVAEGYRRGTRKDYARFVSYSRGSTGEVETDLEISLRRRYVTRADLEPINDRVNHVARMLTLLYGSVRR